MIKGFRYRILPNSTQEQQINQIRDYYDSLRVDNNKNATDTIKNQEDVLFNFRMDLWNKIGGAIGTLGGLFKQHTATSKILALSEIAIGTATGFINALRIALIKPVANQAKTDNLKNSQTEYEILKEKYDNDLKLLKKYGIDATELEIKYMSSVS